MSTLLFVLEILFVEIPAGIEWIFARARRFFAGPEARTQAESIEHTED